MTPFFAFLQREKATLWSGIQRFPAATIIWALSVALLFYITNRWNGWNSFSSDYLVFLTGIVAFFFALGVTLFLEKKTFPRYLTFLLPVIYAVAFFLALDRFSE